VEEAGDLQKGSYRSESQGGVEKFPRRATGTWDLRMTSLAVGRILEEIRGPPARRFGNRLRAGFRRRMPITVRSQVNQKAGPEFFFSLAALPGPA